MARRSRLYDLRSLLAANLAIGMPHSVVRRRVVAWSRQVRRGRVDVSRADGFGRWSRCAKGSRPCRRSGRGRLPEIGVTSTRSIIARDSTDAEALTGLAQVLQWEGRPREARAAALVKSALAAHPDDGDARAEARAKLRPMVSPWIRPTITTWGDNEDNSGEAGSLAAQDGPLPCSPRRVIRRNLPRCVGDPTTHYGQHANLDRVGVCTGQTSGRATDASMIGPMAASVWARASTRRPSALPTRR